jgi:hypothetical protein
MEFNEEEQYQLEVLTLKYLGDIESDDSNNQTETKYYDESFHDLYIDIIEPKVEEEFFKILHMEGINYALIHDEENFFDISIAHGEFYYDYNYSSIKGIINDSKDFFIETKENYEFNNHIQKQILHEIENLKEFCYKAEIDNPKATKSYVKKVLDTIVETEDKYQDYIQKFYHIECIENYVNGRYMDSTLLKDPKGRIIKKNMKRNIYDPIHKPRKKYIESIEYMVKEINKNEKIKLISLEEVYISRMNKIIKNIEAKSKSIIRKKQPHKKPKKIHKKYQKIVREYCEYEYLKTKTSIQPDGNMKIHQPNETLYELIQEARQTLNQCTEDIEYKSTKLFGHLYAAAYRN